MTTRTLIRRLLSFPPIVSLYYFWKYGARVSPRAEVDLSDQLSIGRNTNVSSFAKIKATEGPLRIGRDVSITTGCMISSGTGGLEIGDDTLIGPNVVIIANTYRYDRVEVPYRLGGTTSKGTRIGRNVFIGAGSCILDGAVVGDGAWIAPNSVVSKNVPENAMVSGSPAKVVFVRRA